MWDPKEISEFNYNEFAWFKWQSENPRTEVYETERGLGQGDALSTILFKQYWRKR